MRHCQHDKATMHSVDASSAETNMSATARNQNVAVRQSNLSAIDYVCRWRLRRRTVLLHATTWTM